MRRFIKKIPKKALIVPGIFMIILSMTIVCASLSSTMLINGDAYLRVDEEIRVTNIQMINPTVGAYETVNSKYGKDSTDLFSTLPDLASTISFKITIENTSSDNYILTSVAETLTNDKIVSNASDYEGTIIAPNSTEELTITYEYDTEVLPADTTQSAHIKYTFQKPDASMIEYSSNYTSQTNVQDALDELYEIFE